METTNRENLDTLKADVNLMRQMLVLSRGPLDPIYTLMDEAVRTSSFHKLRRAKEVFAKLPEQMQMHLMGRDTEEGSD